MHLDCGDCVVTLSMYLFAPDLSIPLHTVASLLAERHQRVPHFLKSHNTIAAVLALAAALAFAIASVAQQHAASGVSKEEAAGSGGLMGQLIRDPRWWAGTVGNTGGYLLQAAALGFGSLLLVQPLLVTALLFALPLSARFGNRTVGRVTWIWGLLLTVGLAVFVVLGNPGGGIAHPSHKSWFLLSVVVVPFVGVCLLLAARLHGANRASVLAVAVGVLLGICAVLTKAIVDDLHFGVATVLTSGSLYALLVAGGLGIYLQQVAYHAGGLQASMPILCVLEPVVAAALGFAILREHLMVDKREMAVLVVATIVMAVATVALARGTAAAEEHVS